MRRDFNDYPGGSAHDERRGLLVLSIWTMLLVALICGSGLLAYKIYYETASRADASAEPEGRIASNARPRHRAPNNSDRPARSDSSSAKAGGAGNGEYQVYSASEQPALPSPPERDANREIATARTPEGTNPADAPALPDAATRHALPFSLQRNGPRVAVGPLTLRLEDSDANSPEYSMTACMGTKCLLLTNLHRDQVKAFSMPDQQAPFEVIVTQVGKNQLSGLLTVPAPAHP